MGKRTLAGVAAGALALGALSIAGATSASAKPSIKPKATATATASAVRATGTTSPLNIPPAKLTWKGTTLMSSNGFVDLTTAPTGGATMTLWDSAGTSLDDTVTLNQNGESWGPAYLVGDDTGVYFNVDTAGLYAGIIANGVDTVSFSFTTAGAPASISLTPTTQTVLVGGVGTVNVALKDSLGNTTQPQTVDSITMSSSGDDTIAVTSLTGTVGGKLQFGTFDDTIATQTAGTSTITATPAGTLPASAVAAATATLIKSGTVSTTTVKSITVKTPVKQVPSDLPAPPAAPVVTTSIPEGTTSVTVQVDDTTAAAAGNTIRLKAVLSAGTLNGSAVLTQYKDVTTDAKKQATWDLTIGGSGLLNNATLIVSQVNVSNVAVTPNAQNTITQETPAVTAATIDISPDDSQVAAIGTVTPVQVTVYDQFGTPQPNWTVQAFRGTVSTGTFLNQSTTNALGEANVTVTNAAGISSGTTENYSIKAFYGGLTANDNNTLSIAYTTSGDVTSLSVAVTGGGTTPITNATTSIAVLPYQLVPYGGTASTATSGTYTVATATGTATGNRTTFTPTASPANNVTVTVPEGVKVSTTPSTAWDGGKQTVTVSSGTPVYVFATKTGDHNVVFTSGGKTATAKIKVATAAAAAYNISLTPAAQKLEKGSFGTVNVKLTDVFGNAVPGSAAGAGTINTVTVTASGGVLLGGYQNTQNVTVDATGSATLTVIAGNAAGTGALAAIPATGSDAPAYVTGYVKPVNAPNPTLSAAATVEVTDAASKTITITSSGRTTVSGKPGVYANGSTTGFAEGDTLKVWVKFPGQTSYTEGSAKPALDAQGAFEWSRKTGKKTYVYFSNNDGLVKSASVIIPAK